MSGMIWVRMMQLATREGEGNMTRDCAWKNVQKRHREISRAVIVHELFLVAIGVSVAGLILLAASFA